MRTGSSSASARSATPITGPGSISMSTARSANCSAAMSTRSPAIWASSKRRCGRTSCCSRALSSTKSREEQIDAFRALRSALAGQGSQVKIIVDEWCNTLDDIKAFADAAAADYAQIKTPDLGGVNNAIEAVLYARQKGMGCCLGGSGNETDQSARITAQIGLACRPDFLLSKPGFGGDEALMIQTNEMVRTLALIDASRGASGP